MWPVRKEGTGTSTQKINHSLIHPLTLYAVSKGFVRLQSLVLVTQPFCNTDQPCEGLNILIFKAEAIARGKPRLSLGVRVSRSVAVQKLQLCSASWESPQIRVHPERRWEMSLFLDRTERPHRAQTAPSKLGLKERGGFIRLEIG